MMCHTLCYCFSQNDLGCISPKNLVINSILLLFNLLEYYQQRFVVNVLIHYVHKIMHYFYINVWIYIHGGILDGWLWQQYVNIFVLSFTPLGVSLFGSRTTEELRNALVEPPLNNMGDKTHAARDPGDVDSTSRPATKQDQQPQDCSHPKPPKIFNLGPATRQGTHSTHPLVSRRTLTPYPTPPGGFVGLRHNPSARTGTWGLEPTPLPQALRPLSWYHDICSYVPLRCNKLLLNCGEQSAWDSVCMRNRVWHMIGKGALKSRGTGSPPLDDSGVHLPAHWSPVTLYCGIKTGGGSVDPKFRKKSLSECWLTVVAESGAAVGGPKWGTRSSGPPLQKPSWWIIRFIISGGACLCIGRRVFVGYVPYTVPPATHTFCNSFFPSCPQTHLEWAACCCLTVEPTWMNFFKTNHVKLSHDAACGES